MKGYDIIGDIHGQYNKLTGLLTALGYVTTNKGAWRHPEGRQALFLGDYIDRGPDIRRVLRLVRGMCDSGHALAIMGNHEYNAVCFHTPDGKGDYLRGRYSKNRLQHAATLAEFFDRQEEWRDWVEWMKGLPIYLDLGPVRAVHAAWHPGAIAAVQGASLHDAGFLRASATTGSAEFWAVETLLKGVEIALPEGDFYVDKDGHKRKAIRSRWWETSPAGMSYRGLVFPQAESPPELAVPGECLAKLPGYGEELPPVFVGHYWLPGDSPRGPQRSNIACLDYSAAGSGPLMAYRWSGERTLTKENFVCA